MRFIENISKIENGTLLITLVSIEYTKFCAFAKNAFEKLHSFEVEKIPQSDDVRLKSGCFGKWLIQRSFVLVWIELIPPSRKTTNHSARFFRQNERREMIIFDIGFCFIIKSF